MFSFHSLAPMKLYAGTEKPTPPRSESAMADVYTATAVGCQADVKANASVSAEHLANTTLKNEPRQREPRDSGVGSSIYGYGDNDPVAPGDMAQETELSTHNEPSSKVPDIAPTAKSHVQQPLSHLESESQPASHPEPENTTNFENRTASIDFTNPTAEAGPSTAKPRGPGSSHSSLQHNEQLAAAPAAPRPDESEFNAIAYRRDPETVIAYLVPLPQPKIQGSSLTTTPKYFLYAPPPPHLLKPAKGKGSEGYVRKLNRHWQQNVRRATRNAHNGRIVSAKGVHSKMMRACTWGLDKLKTDDVTFLARIHPKTVNHLILIHPWNLAGTQTPEQVMRTFRAQMFESKKRAKRDSIISAFFFMPALAVDTAAIFFGGLAEIDGIWMCVSVTAYRTAKFITKKMGPEPKTLELEQAKLIEDAKKSKFPPPEPEPEEEEPGAVRRSVDALRRSLGSVKYRMSLNQRRSKSKKGRGGETSSTDTSRPQTNDASRSDIGGFDGGDLGDHAEENEEPATGAIQAAPPSTANSTSDISGFLEHMEEEIPESEQGESSAAGIFAETPDEQRTSAESSSSTKSKKRGSNFQLTFYPSPAMDVLARYMQESCHMKNGQAYSSPNSVPTEEDVLAVVGWHPEQRDHEDAAAQADDEEWQTREIKDDLRQASRKAAKAWNKSCRKQAKQVRRASNRKGGFLMGRRAKVEKGKAKQTSNPDSEAAAATPEAQKKAHAAGIKAKIAAVRARAQRKQQSSSETPTTASPSEDQPAKEKKKHGRAAGGAALLCVPCFAIAERVKHRKAKNETSTAEPQAQSEKSASGLKQRLALRQRMEARKAKKAVAETPVDTLEPIAPVGLETPTAIDGPAATDGQVITPVADTGDQTAAVNDAAQPEKSKKERLLAIPAAIAAAIGAALSKRRSDKNKKVTASDESVATKEKKPSRISTLQERFKARRTRVAKKEPTAKKARLSGLKDWLKVMKQKGKTKSASKSKASDADGDKPKTTQERGAVMGLLAGCFALPAGKVKQVRDKRRSNKTKPAAESNADETPVVAGTPLSPVLEGEPTVRSVPTVVAPLPTTVDRPTTAYQAPIAEEEYDDPPEELPVASQYLPGHGQSEVPVSPGRPPLETGQGSSSTAVEQTTTASDAPQRTKAQAASAAAGVKFKSVRDGLGNLANRRRNGGDKVNEARTEGNTEPAGGESAPTGRFQGLKGGLEGLRAKKRAPEATGPDAVVDDEKKPSHERDANPGGPLMSIKAGLGNMRAKKTGTEPPAVSEKVNKEKPPGFVERMRWILMVA